MGWLSLLPPSLAIALALWKKNVTLALLLALLAAELLLAHGQPLLAAINSIERLVAVFASADNTRILLFSALVGALLSLLRHSGGVGAFIHMLLRSGIAKGPRSAAVLTYLLGIIVFIESYLSVLVTGTFGQVLFDRFRLSRARLALLVDTTCSPVSVLILLNGWGAYILGLLQGYGLNDPVNIVLQTVRYNFYPLLVLALTFYVAVSGRVHGKLAVHEQQVNAVADLTTTNDHSSARYFLVPLLLLIGGILFFLWDSGAGDLRRGNGASAVLYAVLLALGVLYAMRRLGQQTSHHELTQQMQQGLYELLPIVLILLLAFAFSAAMKALALGEFVAQLFGNTLPLWTIAPLLFLAGCVISFTTGTSWGTFAILIPVAVPVALSSGLPVPLLVAAVLSGGVFGDHCSPISDSTILSSLASGCDHMTHVQTQLPYALTAGISALLLFAMAG
jgi:tetracycline resistance efflux pump